MKKLTLILFCLAQGCLVAAETCDPNDPEALLKTKWDCIVSVLDDEDLAIEAKKSRIGEIVTPIFDFPLMSKLALGRKHWPRLTEEQQAGFTELFVKKLKDSYGEKISLYQGQTAVFKPCEKGQKVVRVPVELLSDNGNVEMLYKFRWTGEQWLIYDVEVQGVSVLLTYRSQFNDILEGGSVEDLLGKLEE